jgi:predicted metalloprotease with PDZ domain
MPTSTVKHVSGPPQLEKTERKCPILINPVLQLSTVIATPLALRTQFFIICGLLSLTIPSSVRAQTVRARISVTSVAPARVRIDAELSAATNALSFRNSYGGSLGLGERIEMLEAVNARGESVAVQKLAPGEFQTAEKFTRFRYEVNVAEPSRPAQMSHVSWVNREQGLLMLADLLPTARKDSGNLPSALITVDVPVGWSIASNAKHEGSQFSTDDPDNAVFLIGPLVHEQTQQLLATNSLSIITSGQWPFSNKDASKIARKLIEEYSKVTRFDLKRNPVLMLIPFPGEAGPESWSAETRGNDVVLLLGRRASGKRVLSRLGIVLSHELFHLWVPNSLQLTGDYDWFFEGFTLYQALRMALRLRLISFDDYLSTIARVYDSYSLSIDRDRISLIEASERRWTNSSSFVYEKGMLAAFIYDLSLRNRSNCRVSLDDVYADLFRTSATGQGSANEIIIKLLSEQHGLESFAKDYVESAGKIELDSVVAPYGIQVQHASPGANATKLVISHNLNKVQRKLLGCIGNKD